VVQTTTQTKILNLTRGVGPRCNEGIVHQMFAPSGFIISF